MYKILCVCMANSCRSTIAQGLLEQLSQQKGAQKLTVDSAGLADDIGIHAPDPNSIEICSQHGIDISQQRSRSVTPEDFGTFDLILVMDNDNLEMANNIATKAQQPKIKLLMHYATHYQADEVPDPYMRGEQGFALVFDMINDACQGVMSSLIKQ